MLLTGSLVTWGQSNASLVESWGKDVVPLFLGERMSSINKMKLVKFNVLPSMIVPKSVSQIYLRLPPFIT